MAQGATQTSNASAFKDRSKPDAVRKTQTLNLVRCTDLKQVRNGNIQAARAVSDAIRTSLGPRVSVDRECL